jgi:hypothetical protein
LSKHNFATVVHAGEARGYGWPFNMGFFSVCRAPYVAVIEDDFPGSLVWFSLSPFLFLSYVVIADAGRVLKRADLFSEAVELLVRDLRFFVVVVFFFFSFLKKLESSAVGVVLKSDHWLLEHGLCEDAPRKSVNNSETFLCKAKVVFGSYTNSAAV